MIDRSVVAKFVFVLFVLSSVFYSACKKDPQLVTEDADSILFQKYFNFPDKPYNYSNVLLPTYFDFDFLKFQNNIPNSNLISDWGATLGRVLFYDKNLSLNNTISCASCHIQAFGFTDTARLSKGFNGGNTQRHSMSLINSRFYSSGKFFWDERAETLEKQALMPIQDLVEMGMNLNQLVSKLRAIEYYPALFKKAFGSDEIDTIRLSKALAQFMRSIVSVNSKFDDGRKVVTHIQDNFPNYTAQENLGKNIFIFNRINCFGCHITDAFVMDNPRNNGLNAFIDDKGVFNTTQNPRDLGVFKAPSLKNVALRKRFMHDGSLVGLDAVIEHYNSGIQENQNLDPHLIDLNTGLSLKMNLTNNQKAALKAFLETLTDYQLIQDEKYSNPFKL